MSTFIDLDSVWRDRSYNSNPCDYQLQASQVAPWVKAARDVRVTGQNPNERPRDFVNSLSVSRCVLPYPRVELYSNQLVTVTSIDSSNNVVVSDSSGFIPVNGDYIITSSLSGSSFGISSNTWYRVVNAPLIPPPGPAVFQLSLDGLTNIPLTQVSAVNIVMAYVPITDFTDVYDSLYAARRILDFPCIYLDFHSKLYNDTRAINSLTQSLSDAKFVLTYDKVQLDASLTPVWIIYKSHGEQVMRFKRDDVMIIKFMTRDGTPIPFYDEPDLTIPTNPQKQSLLTIEVTPYLRDASYANHTTDPIPP